MSHQHHHKLNGALWLTTVFALVELVGGYISGSLALLADAGHMALDIIALSLAVVARRIAEKPAHAGMTYGYGRAKVLAAQLNGITLWALAIWIVFEAFERLGNPLEVQGDIVLIIAVFGLLVNLIIMKWLSHSHDINTRAAYWHVLGDALGSVAAIISGLIIIWTGWMPIDPILSFVVAGILLWGGWRLLYETTMDLMEAAPQDIDVAELKLSMQQVVGVKGLHHIHVWRLPNGEYAVSAHVQVHRMEDWSNLLDTLRQILSDYDINHATLQPELDMCAQQDNVCTK